MPVRIVVRGAGAVSAAGYGCAAQLTAAQRDRVTWRRDAATERPVYAVPTPPPPGPPALAELLARRRPDRSTELALYAAEEAVAAAGWAGRDFAVLVGCSRGPTLAWEEAFATFAAGTPLPVATSPRTTLGAVSATLAQYFGQEGLADATSMTCSSGFHALLQAFALLRAGLCRRVLVGGAEAPLSAFTQAQIAAIGVYAGLPEPGQAACRPFADPPSGMVLGEGAAFLALEAVADAPVTGPELLAVGAARENGRGRTGISERGDALGRAMRAARELAGADPRTVVAHAPGTRRGDAAERHAIADAFGPGGVAVRSYKRQTGHTLGASGPLALVAALTDGAVAGPVLVNAAGFGGNAVAVLVAK